MALKKKKFIEGIYNYCDRWCEKCAFTSKCLNYDMLEQEGHLESSDKDNRQFWDSIALSLQKTIELLHKIADENGIDLNSIEIDPEIEKKREQIIKNHPLTDIAKRYATLVDEFFNKRIEQINNSLNLMGDFEKSHRIIDAIDIIKWYQRFVHAKIDRAIGSAFNEEQLPDDIETYDSLGSAKITLVSIDRSMASWTIIYSHFHEMLDDIIPILAQLEMFKKSINTYFPKAQEFKRPGFDE